MIHIDAQILKRLPLLRFMDKGSYHYEFRCPVCGDSKKSKTKRRGSAYPTRDKNSLLVHCYNCNYISGFAIFLKDYFPDYFEQYKDLIRIEKFGEFGERRKEKPVEMPDMSKFANVLKNKTEKNDMFVPIADLKETHPAREYLIYRQVSENLFGDIYYTPNFALMINTHYLKDKYSYIPDNDSRVVFPIYNEKRDLIALQGRVFNREVDPRYRFMTIKLKDEYLWYGLDKIDKTKTVYITEGIYDALMLDNCIAMLRLDWDEKEIKKVLGGCKIAFVIDNELRNKDVARAYKKVAEHREYGLFVWPMAMRGVKDLNEAVLKGYDVKKIVTMNTFYDTIRKKIMLV